MEKIIVLPRKFVKHTIDKVLEEVINPDLSPVSKEIKFDLTKVEFIDPCGMTALYNICLWLKKIENVKATFILNDSNQLPKYNKATMEYLVDCGFFKEFFKDQVLYKKPSLRTTTLPVRKLKSKESYSWKEHTLKPWLQKCSEKACEFSSIQTAVDEIFNNITDHSNQKIGCVFAQFFPKLNEIQIAISDFGIGIPTSMRRIYPNKSDVELLKTACQEGISTHSIPNNRGAGLTNILTSLTNQNVGIVHIHSNHGIIQIENKIITNSQMSKSFYPGTLFCITLFLNNSELYELDEEEEFKWF